MNTDLISYYRERAKEYENIYLKPERQNDLKKATSALQQTFSGKNVLELACGTGYWTEKIAQTARSVYATDINESVIDIAKQKNYQNTNVSFGLADMFTVWEAKKYESLFGGFIWSHIRLQDINRFLQIVNSFVLPGGMVTFMDNIYIEGSSIPITKTDEQGNTFQTRKLEDGSSHLVLKNFPSETFIKEQLRGYANDIRFINLEYYWIVSYMAYYEKK